MFLINIIFKIEKSFSNKDRSNFFQIIMIIDDFMTRIDSGKI